jgi:hypothetical protein
MVRRTVRAVGRMRGRVLVALVVVVVGCSSAPAAVDAGDAAAAADVARARDAVDAGAGEGCKPLPEGFVVMDCPTAPGTSCVCDQVGAGWACVPRGDGGCS